MIEQLSEERLGELREIWVEIYEHDTIGDLCYIYRLDTEEDKLKLIHIHEEAYLFTLITDQMLVNRKKEKV